jgi:hypothetical protein
MKMPDNQEKLPIPQLFEDLRELPNFFRMLPQSEFSNFLIRGQCPKVTLEILEMGLKTPKYNIESLSEAELTRVKQIK